MIMNYPCVLFTVSVREATLEAACRLPCNRGAALALAPFTLLQGSYPLSSNVALSYNLSLKLEIIQTQQP